MKKTTTTQFYPPVFTLDLLTAVLVTSIAPVSALHME